MIIQWKDYLKIEQENDVAAPTLSTPLFLQFVFQVSLATALLLHFATVSVAFSIQLTENSTWIACVRLEAEAFSSYVIERLL